MINIIAFGASTSSSSMNRQLAAFAASQFNNATTEILDLNDYEMPLYSSDRERAHGVPEAAKQFYQKLQSADLILVSLAEHNGTYTAAFKNIFDWVSRHEANLFGGKPVILLSTSPGPRAGAGVMEAARVRFPIHGANIVGHFSLPKFSENFHPETGIINPDLRTAFETMIADARGHIDSDTIAA